MTKKLKIRFVKFEKALVAQQLDITGEFESSEDVLLTHYGISFADKAIWISVKPCNDIGFKLFGTNAERDEYFNNVVEWISEEQFNAGGKLELGKKCEASHDGKNWFVRIFAGKTARQLGEPRYLAAYNDVMDDFGRYKYVRPLGSCVQPKIDGDVYTWEMEVSE